MNNFRNQLELLFESDLDGKIYNLVREQLGKSGRLKRSMAAGEITLDQIIQSIKTERCVRTPERDFGSTYLETMVGQAIRKVIPTQYINHARLMFGLEKLSPHELNKHKETLARNKGGERQGTAI